MKNLYVQRIYGEGQVADIFVYKTDDPKKLTEHIKRTLSMVLDIPEQRFVFLEKLEGHHCLQQTDEWSNIPFKKEK